MKIIEWVGSSLDDLKKMSSASRHRLGYQLYRIQCGLDPHDFKAFSEVGKGVFEIRLRDENNKNIVRCFYAAKLGTRIFVLHCFTKKTQQTSKRDIKLAQDRYRSIYE